MDRYLVLDVIEGHSRDVLAGWLAERGYEWCLGIRLATSNPAAGYRLALTDHLPIATLVVHCFQCVKLTNQAIDDVRRRVQTRRSPASLLAGLIEHLSLWGAFGEREK